MLRADDAREDSFSEAAAMLGGILRRTPLSESELNSDTHGAYESVGTDDGGNRTSGWQSWPGEMGISKPGKTQCSRMPPCSLFAASLQLPDSFLAAQGSSGQ